jgi:hypothetical protein
LLLPRSGRHYRVTAMFGTPADKKTERTTCALAAPFNSELLASATPRPWSTGHGGGGGGVRSEEECSRRIGRRMGKRGIFSFEI